MPMEHVDQFIDGHWGEHQYARWFFMLHRFPAAHQSDFAEWVGRYKLFCTFEGKRWRVTGCSRMGDVWLAADFTKEHGYDKRVDVGLCGDFTPTPELIAEGAKNG